MANLDMLDEDGPLSKYLQDNGSEDDIEDRTGEADLKDDPLFNLDLSVSEPFSSSFLLSN